VDQARAEARAAEAAAEQRIAAALALERAECNKQARSWLCMCGNRNVRCTALACICTLCVRQTAWSRFACHAPGSMGIGVEDELQCMDAPDLPMMPYSQSRCAQVYQARTEARAEAEAAAEQHVAAALALERADLAKQARGLLCTCGTWPCPYLLCRDHSATDWSCMAAYVTAEGTGGTRAPQ